MRQFLDSKGKVFDIGTNREHIYVVSAEPPRIFTLWKNGKTEDNGTYESNRSVMSNFHELPEKEFIWLDIIEKVKDNLGIKGVVLKCICEIHLLVNQGCKCGAFQREHGNTLSK